MYNKSKLQYNLFGKRFGHLIAIERRQLIRQYDKKKRIGWLCKCDCGSYTIVRSDALRRGDTKTCGCKKYRIRPRNRLKKGEAAFRTIYRTYKAACKKRKRKVKFLLTEKQFKDIASKNCYYCGREPNNVSKDDELYGEYIYNGIDRIDNEKNYTTDNSVPCCKICNFMKRNLTKEAFLDKIKMIYENMRLDAVPYNLFNQECKKTIKMANAERNEYKKETPKNNKRCNFVLIKM